MNDDTRWDRVDAYFGDLFRTNDETLEAALAAQRAAGLPEIDVAPNQGELLMLLVQLAGARRVLEIGTLGGYSTIWLARGAGPEGRVVTSEGAGPFDFVFLDANEDGYPEYLAWALRLARPGTVIVADDVVRGGRVLDAGTTDANVASVRRFAEFVAVEPRLSATAVQTVGSKGYDGFAIARVTG